MKKKIYVCGNPLVDVDAMPFKILPELRLRLPEIEFVEFDPTENFPEADPLYIIDTVINADWVRVLKDVEAFVDSPRFSSHDADLAFHLKWLKKMGKMPKVVIFGVPAEGEAKRILADLAAVITREI